VKSQQQLNVAVLLATYNGGEYVDQQIRSLKENATPSTLHWLDDHSSDNTRSAVRASALTMGIPLCAWHQPRHQGVPGAFFQLIECVEADIYLFCDQDDIWQP
jgi:rhamnosyltransferase